jgi:predicted secreted protein
MADGRNPRLEHQAVQQNSNLLFDHRPSTIGHRTIQGNFITKRTFFMPLTNPENIHFKVGEKKIVRLEGKSTAGYEWGTIYDKELLHLSKSFKSSKDAPPGSSAAEEFTITALKAGNTVLKFHLKREWEDKADREMSVKVEITL